MTCITDISAILQKKPGYQKISKILDSGDSSELSTKEGFLDQYISMQNATQNYDKLEDSKKLEISLDNIDKIISGSVRTDIQYLHFKGDISSIGYDKLLELMERFPKLVSLDWGLTELHEITGMTSEKLLELMERFPKLVSLGWGKTELHEIPGMTYKLQAILKPFNPQRFAIYLSTHRTT